MCRGGHLAKVLTEHGHEVIATDIVDRGYPGTKILNFIRPSIEQTDVLKGILNNFSGDIVTNPPYSILNEFLVRALAMLKPNSKLAILGRIQVIESQGRREIYDKHPIKTIYVPSKRIICSMGGTFKETSSAVCYAWFVWQKGYTGETQMKWLD